MTEFGFIDSIKTLFAPLPDNGFEGIGDDCSVLSVGGGESLVFTADLLTEGVHFLRTATSPRSRSPFRPMPPMRGPQSSCSATGNCPRSSA